MNDTDTARLRERMADDLVRAGYLTPAWHDAFAAVPRHLFLPQFFRLTPDGLRYVAVEAGDPGALELIYSDTVLPTQLDGDDTLWARARGDGPVQGTPTSSNTQPSLMAIMLDALDVRDGARVLELGLGTAYMSALLSHRLGARLVTSVDIDATVVEQAGRNLTAVGYTPTIAAVNGEDGYPGNAPYDRVLATVSVPDIPAAWITQAAPGAVIVTHLYRDLGGHALVALTVENDGSAHGNFLAAGGNFMPVRSHHGPDAMRRLNQAVHQDGDIRAVTSGLTGEDDGGPFVTFSALLLPGVARLDFQPHDAGPQVWLFTVDSWACRDIEGGTVEQYGPRFLWDELEGVHIRWDRIGRPARDRLGLTVTSDGTRRLWVDSPADTVGTL